MRRLAVTLALILFAFVSPAVADDLIFTEGNNFTESGSFMVMGFVKNTSSYTMKEITITIKYYDRDENFLRFATTTTDPAVLGPGEEASYRVAVPEDKRIATIKKTARWSAKE
jgi:hypothetical protein